MGPFVEIQAGVKIGPRSRVQSHSFICTGVTIGKDVFIGHGVMFINDKYPVQRDPGKWEKTLVEDKVAIGSNATIMTRRIGKNALVGAGAVVTKDVQPNKVVVGCPAKVIGERK